MNTEIQIYEQNGSEVLTDSQASADTRQAKHWWESFDLGIETTQPLGPIPKPELISAKVSLDACDVSPDYQPMQARVTWEGWTVGMSVDPPPPESMG